METLGTHSMANLIGNTPLVEFRTKQTRAKILVKLESYNPTGSIKDRACINMLKHAGAKGQLHDGVTLLDASSGNMACALAYYGKLLHLPVRVICNSKLTEDKKAFIRFFGAELQVSGNYTIEGNRHCRQLASKNESLLFMDQLHNTANPEAYYETLAPEIMKEVRDVVAIVGSLGSGGTMCGVSRYFRDNAITTQIFTVQSAAGTKIAGTGAFDDGDYRTAFINEVMSMPNHRSSIRITQQQAEKRTRQLADQGIFTGFQGGAVLQGALTAIESYGIVGNLVIIIGDSGWKNMDKLKALK